MDQRLPPGSHSQEGFFASGTNTSWFDGLDLELPLDPEPQMCLGSARSEPQEDYFCLWRDEELKTGKMLG